MDTSDIDGGYQTTDAENPLAVFKSSQTNHDDDFSFHTGDADPELI